ncbi:hypothetical protein COJ96_10945 [Bacillus sp. AFS073361]|uniref:tape measure protein n=1 Tax=Bacillus sp. AFS073361 TaxID=2033511 RepID=UPI000BFA16AE|nr:tape measure protein [Bacillus sp. AFS073361]PFP29413.1 hypothetical protein COJ96_10945 [Bacillus sp. AFS073361]
MADVGSANIEISADDSPARRSLSGFLGHLRGFGSIAAGVVGGLTIFEGLSSTLQGVANATIGANANMEQYENTLTTVLKSHDKAKETLQWAEKFAAQTPFEIPDIVEATTRLSAYGLKAQDVLGATGDMAAVMGKPLMQAVEAVADAQTGELERLKEFGITKNMLIEEAADTYGEALVNEKNQIADMDLLNKTLFSLMNKRFKGGMELQSQTFKGLVSNATDGIGTLAREMSKPIFEKLKAGLAQAIPVLTAFTSFVTGDMKGARETLVVAFGEETAGKIEGFFVKIQGYFEQAKQFVKDLGPTLDNVKGILVNLFPIIKDFGALFGLAVGGAAEGLPPLLEGISGIGKAVTGWDGFTPIVEGLAAGFGTYKLAVEAVTQAQEIYGKVTAAVTLIQRAWTAAVAASALAGGGFKGVIAGVRAGMAALNLTMLANPFVWIPALIVGVIIALVALYRNSETFRKFVDKLWAGIKKAFNGFIRWATVSLPKWWNDTITGFKNMGSKVSSSFSNLKDSAVSKIKGLWNGVKDWVGKIPGKFTEMKNKITSTVKGINLYSIGKNIVQGLLNGLGSMLRSVKNKAREISTAVSKAIKDKLKMKSPSRVMVEIGEFTGQGFVLGMDNMIADVSRKARRMGEAATDVGNVGIPIRQQAVNLGKMVNSKLPDMSGDNKGPYVFQVNMNSRTVAQEVYEDISALQNRAETQNSRARGEVKW